jgi:predicted permease
MTHVIAIVLSKIFIRSKEDDKRVIFRFGVVFSNCGFMALPLLEALLGSDGVFYGAAYVAVFNVCVWTYGIFLMDRDCKKISFKKAFLNPGVLPVIVGLIFFFTGIKLPEIGLSPMKYLAALNTPVPMLIIGYNIAGLNISKALKDVDEYKMLLLRLIVTPLITFGILYALGIRENLLVSCVVSASAPVAATGTMFSVKYKRDAVLSAETVAISTLLSVLTMTLVVGIAYTVAF